MSTKQPVSYYKIATVANPVAGDEFAFVAPGGEFWRMVSVAFTLVTSAVVANRVLSLVADDQTDVWFRVVSNQNVPAAQTVNYCGFPGAPQNPAVNNKVMIPFPDLGLLLPPGMQLRSVTDLIDAGDQYSAIRALVQVFPQGPVTEWLPTVDTQLTDMR